MSAGEEHEDLLGINKLSVDYSYLLYKIQDHVESIQLQTTKICVSENQSITEGIIANIVDKNIEDYNLLLKKCEELEHYFDMLDQIEVISETFKDRLREATKDLVDINRKRGHR
ncbi:hypothetical protein TBLA_0A03630 [Henningerozyma blattae CBS 6284]|uniref:Biogenesis of lysosome-related organelles complex 1 subunit CNL1 n=1 Tax=Henningerozyma blattae (strain ATCC 34711 / CBS 6284 / DSM 70876 / NBRC 10599 / NRRL Y-10934 / UCD 77-7) TaxID=1071380 RepID=I2GVK9_HENB6|nr:hypothetical protein TBLA_0A03630 [Tetrapisispora blattae CBS 6284]CCH58161.1 hypothetical protein TBLA_0A03630 [Tetrapisispora blattae CBS 6284]